MGLGILMLWLVLALMLHGTYVVVFRLLKRVNDWYHISSMGEEKYNCLPPGDMGWPLIGNMYTFFKAFRSDDPDSFIYNLVNRYGRTGIYKAHLFGGPCVIVCLPETCRRVLTDDDKFELGYPKSTIELTGKKSFHGISDTEHKRLRKITTGPINGHEALAMYVGYIEELVISALEDWATMDRPIELLSETRKFAFKVITHIFLGSSSDEVIGSAQKLYADLSRGLKSAAINIPGFAFHRALKARKNLVQILQRVLDERRAMNKKNKQRRCMLDLMMEIEDEHGRRLDDEDIIDMLLVFLLAGHESSAHGAMWAVLYLHQCPEMLQKAKVEQEDILKRRPPTQNGLNLTEIRRMEYLPKVIDETLRRTSLSFCNFRRAKVDVNINGYIVPKGWKVLVWNRGVHMDPQTYSAPKEFNPSRWDNFTPKAGAFIPFAAGSRFCPGADLAKLEITIFLHYFILNYKLEQLNPECALVHLPIPRPKDNCLARIKKLT